MRPDENTKRALFMAEHALVEAVWDEEGALVSAKRSPTAAPRLAPVAPAGPAAKVADAFAGRLQRQHDVRFAASHFKPRLDQPKAADDVPRAVRSRGASDGRPATK